MRERLQNYETDADGCHIWQGYVDRNGYGRVYDPGHGGLYWVHRVAYSTYNGPIPPRHEIDHECEKTLCIRPICIVAVTKAEHVARTYRRLGKDARQLVAAELRREGMTFAEIAESMKLSGKSTAHDMVQAAIDKGLVPADAFPSTRKLTESEREDIRDLYAVGVPQMVLGEFYCIDPSQVSRICNGKSSGH